jgi:hypothetical protein
VCGVNPASIDEAPVVDPTEVAEAVGEAPTVDPVVVSKATAVQAWR